MGKAILTFLVLIVLGGAVAYSTGFIKLNAGVNAGICQQDTEIPAATREAMQDRAMSFLQAFLAGDTAKAFGMMTPDAQKSAPEEKLAEISGVLQKTAAPFDPPTVAHTYFVQSKGGGPNTRTVCGTLADDKWVAVEIKPGFDQGHVWISAKARNNDWAFTFWLLPNGNDWRVAYFNANPSSIVGLTPGDLLQKARSERDSHHAFNATLLYIAAASISNFGPSFQLGVAQPLQEDLSKLQAPSELMGKPPFTWDMQGKKYIVQQVSIIGVAGKIGLIFQLPQTTWNGDEQADKSNRDFINAFIATHSDYSRDFSFLVARALKPDGSGGFGTVYQNGKGFD